MRRNTFVGAVGATLLSSAAPGLVAAAPNSGAFTAWGWPLPYEPVSATSVAWLKQKGWWPLKMGAQPGFTSPPIGGPKGFYAARGLELEVVPFLSGPAINEAAIAGRVHVGVEGNLPFTALLSKRVPVRCLAVANPSVKHATMVPPNSPINSLADLKGMSPPAAFGIVTGSSAEFYFDEALRAHGMEPGKDVILENLSPPDMLVMPRGITGVVQWAPYVWQHLQTLKNAKQIDTNFSYNLYMGNFWIRQELIDSVPDVAQAILDTYVEGILFARYSPAEALDIFTQDAIYKRFPRELNMQTIRVLNNLYKPTWFYPQRWFWSIENARVAAWLYKTKRLDTLVTAQTYFEGFEPKFADKAMEKLGWKVPQRPPMLPANWHGTVGHIPYPPYYNEDTLKTEEAFPQRGDLQRPWRFGGKAYSA